MKSIIKLTFPAFGLAILGPVAVLGFQEVESSNGPRNMFMVDVAADCRTFVKKAMDRFNLALLIAGLVLVSHMALAQTNFDQGTSEQNNWEHTSPEQRNCRHTQGQLVEVYDAEKKTAFGKLRNSGWLDGTTESVDSSVPFPTADPNKLSFSQTITLTTTQGQLKGKRLLLFDQIAGIGTDISEFDGRASTGIFAGATGVLYTNTLRSDTVEQGPYHAVVYARICLAH